MNIVLVHNHYRQRSGEDVVFQLEAQVLRSRGHRVTTYCRSNDEIHLQGPISKLVLLRDAIWSSESRRGLAAILRARKPDVVHVHNTFARISPSIYSACAEAAVPVVQTLHNYRMFCSAGTFYRAGRVCEACLEGGSWRGVWHGCYANSRVATAATTVAHAAHRYLNTWDRGITRYIALTRFSEAKFAQAGVPSAKIRVKPNFVDPDPGAKSGAGRYALYAGRLSPEKRLDVVIEAWSRLRTGIPLSIVGGGPELESLRREVGRRRLDSIHFFGQLPRAAALEKMRDARFLVLSSGWYENFPMVIAESFAVGLPVICPRLGAMGELVAHGRTGLHYEPSNAAELAEKVAWAWTHGKEIGSMGREARKEYEAKYTAQTNYPLLMDIYEDAIQERRGTGVPVQALASSIRERSTATT